MEELPLLEIEVSHFKGSIWLTTSLEGVAIARGTANAFTEKGLAHTGQGPLTAGAALTSIGIRTIELVRRIVVEAPGIADNSGSFSLPTKRGHNLVASAMLLRTSANSSSLTRMPKPQEF
jgi:hypothetical protein